MKAILTPSPKTHCTAGSPQAGLLDIQLGDHPPKRSKRCGRAVKQGMAGERRRWVRRFPLLWVV